MYQPSEKVIICEKKKKKPTVAAFRSSRKLHFIDFYITEKHFSAIHIRVLKCEGSRLRQNERIFYFCSSLPIYFAKFPLPGEIKELSFCEAYKNRLGKKEARH